MGNEMAKGESWISLMRAAAMKALKPQDVEAIVEKQVEKAIEGDQQAAKFVFDVLLGGKGPASLTLVQNNYTEPETAPARQINGETGPKVYSPPRNPFK